MGGLNLIAASTRAGRSPIDNNTGTINANVNVPQIGSGVNTAAMEYQIVNSAGRNDAVQTPNQTVSELEAATGSKHQTLNIN